MALASRREDPASRPRAGWALLPGLMLVAPVTAAALLVGRLVPAVGPVVFGLLLGALLRTVGAVRPQCLPGIAFAGKQVLGAAVALLGLGLSLGQVWTTGWHSLPVTLVTLSLCLSMAALLGRLLRVPPRLRVLVGVGTGICGASAIAAAAPVIQASETEVAYAVSTIFLFNALAVLVFPPLGHLLHLSQRAFGVWAGTAVNDTSSVVAAAFAYGRGAGRLATVVKLARSTLILPITLGLALARGAAGGERRWGKMLTALPWFLFAFLGCSVVATLRLLPAAAAAEATRLATLLIVAALSAIGLAADLRKLRQAGARPLLLGLGLWATVALSSLAVQRLTGAWGAGAG